MLFGATFPRNGIPEQPNPARYINEVARELDQLGFAYCATGDRLETGLDPYPLFAAMAESSGKMKLITAVLVLPPRGILVSAKQFASLDVITGGRAIAGVGTGSTFKDYEIVGMSQDEMWPRFEEGVKAMRSYLKPGSPPFQGKYYNTIGVDLQPKGPQKDGVPIWIGSWGSNAGLKRVVRLADGWLSSAGPGHQSPEQFKEDIKLLEGFLVQEGKDPARFPHAVATMAMFISEDKEELERIGGPGYVPRPEGWGLAQPAIRPLEDPHAHDMIGTRAQCIDKVRRWKAAGAQALFVGPRGPDPMQQFRVFMEDVASKV